MFPVRVLTCFPIGWNVWSCSTETAGQHRYWKTVLRKDDRASVSLTPRVWSQKTKALVDIIAVLLIIWELDAFSVSLGNISRWNSQQTKLVPLQLSDLGLSSLWIYVGAISSILFSFIIINISIMFIAYFTCGPHSFFGKGYFYKPQCRNSNTSIYWCDFIVKF